MTRAVKIRTLLVGAEPLDEMFDVAAVLARLTPRHPVADFRVGHECQTLRAHFHNSRVLLLLLLLIVVVVIVAFNGSKSQLQGL